MNAFHMPRAGASDRVALRLLISLLLPLVIGCASTRNAVPPNILLRVVDRGGTPLPGACARQLGGDLSTETGIDGIAFFTPVASTGPIIIEVRLSGHERGLLLLDRGASYPMLELPLDTLIKSLSGRSEASESEAHESTRLRGRLIDANGEPLPHAVIRLVGTELGAFARVPDGEFLVHGMTAGIHDVKFSMVGYQPQSMSIDFAEESPVSCLVLLRLVIWEVPCPICRFKGMRDLRNIHQSAGCDRSPLLRPAASDAVAMNSRSPVPNSIPHPGKTEPAR